MGYIKHDGVKRRSGRFPWGSGKRPYQGDDQESATAQRLSKMTNEEIQDKINRLELEKKYLSLVKKAPTYEAAEKYVKSVSNTVTNVFSAGQTVADFAKKVYLAKISGNSYHKGLLELNDLLKKKDE